MSHRSQERSVQVLEEARHIAREWFADPTLPAVTVALHLATAQVAARYTTYCVHVAPTTGPYPPIQLTLFVDHASGEIREIRGPDDGPEGCGVCQAVRVEGQRSGQPDKFQPAPW